MKKLMANMAMAAGGAALVLASTLPAPAQSYPQRYRYVYTYCQQYPDDPDCYDFGRYGHRWSGNRYDDWYRRHYGNYGYNGADAAIATIFGMVAGAIANSAMNAPSRNRVIGDDHVQRCAARFRSYDARSDTYMGYDGFRHTCNL